MKHNLTVEDLKRDLSYDPASGHFTWLRPMGPRGVIPSGSRAGHLCPRSGYVFIRLSGVLYRAGRLAWLHETGEWPPRELEYINGQRSDNRFSNLRVSAEREKKVVSIRKDGTPRAPELSAEYLRSRIDYDPETGVFKWKTPAGKHGHIPAGTVAGYIDPRGYRRISLFDYPFLASRLAVLYVTGYWPAKEIDHINNDTADDRWVNLRQASSDQNKQNRRKPRNNTSGHKGVFVDKNRPGRFRAAIDAYGRRHYLGSFSTIEEAIAARDKATHDMHGKFANFSSRPPRTSKG